MIRRLCEKQRPVEGVQWLPDDAVAVKETLAWLFDSRASFRSAIDSRSTRLLHIDTTFGNSITVAPGMWIVQHPTESFIALEDEKIRERYDEVVTPSTTK